MSEINNNNKIGENIGKNCFFFLIFIFPSFGCKSRGIQNARILMRTSMNDM